MVYYLGLEYNKYISKYSVTTSQYQALSKNYDVRFKSYIRAATDKAVIASKDVSCGKILDLGCGTGELLVKLAQCYPNAKELIGIDLSEDMLSFARAKMSALRTVTLHQGNVEKIPFADGHFDLVISSGVLHYIYNTAAMAHETNRVLKPGGHFVLIDMAQESLTTKLSSTFRNVTDPGAVRFYHRQSAAELLIGQGFKIKSSELFKAGYFGLFLIIAVKQR